MMDTLSSLSAALADRYRIERELGQGGMATVYLAQDLRHDRKVAIKVLRPELAAVIGAERFLREIKTIANLQHPHILGLIDSGEVGGTAYYVMPFVDGESLRDRLTRERQLPVAEAVRLATEVASALDYAHRHGVIHRDIKPENILLHDGSALVADFGIALAVSSAGGSRMTETGMSLGTPHYMSPEQAMGEREITARSDVYALGAMTYEMLVGEPPFTGPTAQAIVAKVMTAEPASITGQRRSVPVHVEEAVLIALDKLPADRFGSAAEFSAALAGQSPVTRTRRAPARPRPSRRLVWSAALVFIMAVAAAYFAGRHWGPDQAAGFPPSRLAIVTPTLGGSGASALSRQLTISPSGDALVYVGEALEGGTSLFYHPLDALAPVEITGSRGMSGPAFTPDGTAVLGITLAEGLRLPLEGGVPRSSGLPPTVLHGAFAPDGSYYITNNRATQVSRLTPDDSLRAIPQLRAPGLRIQQMLDDRTALVVRAPLGTTTGPGVLLDVETGEITPLLEGPVVELRVVGDELLIIRPDGTLNAAPFDPRRRRVLGAAVEVASGLALTGTGLAQFAVAPNGTIAYIPETPRSLVLLRRDGTLETAITEQLNIHAPEYSPDGRRISFDITTAEGRDVWVYSLDQRSLTRASFDRDGHDATWTPDGRFITYLSFRSGVAGIYRTRPGSSAPAESLLASPRLGWTGYWLPDGSALITSGTNLPGAGGGDVVRIANQGRGPLEPVVASSFEEEFPALSPDGRYLAFVSNKSGQQEVYAQPLDDESGQVLVSEDAGVEPVWSPDGREIFYRTLRNGELHLAVTTLATTPALAVTGRRTLFSIADMIGAAPHANFDISPDGRTFAMVRRSPGSRIVVIQNLPALLRRLRGAGSRQR